MLRGKEKITGALSKITTDYKSRKRKNYKNKPMNLASTFRYAARKGKRTSVLSQITTDYKSRKRKNDKNKRDERGFYFS